MIGWSCIVMAVLLAIAELRARHLRTIDDVSPTDAMLVGIAQVGALIPGVSRSGSTLTAALGLGFKRDEAARFSFLLGLPAIALAGFKELWELHKAHLDAARMVDPRGRPPGRLALGLCRDLGADAGAGALLGLAVRGLPRPARRDPAGRCGGGLARLTETYRVIVSSRSQRTDHGQRHTSQACSRSRTEKKITCARPIRFSNGTKPTSPGTRLSAELSRLSPIMK